MQRQPIRDPAEPLDLDVVAGAVLGHLIHDHPGLQTPDELIRKLTGFSGDARGTRTQVLDALSDLAAHGLVHQLENFVFATQAGVRGYPLTG